MKFASHAHHAIINAMAKHAITAKPPVKCVKIAITVTIVNHVKIVNRESLVAILSQQ
jgi:hypothetical protein